MARIVIASEAGACYGVERALQMVERAADEAAGPVHTLGPLIHNPRVVDGLAARGVTVVESPEEAAGGTLLLRTHGVTPDEEARARKLCSEVLDATCPFVKKVHLAARRLADEGYQVVVVGEKGHPEVEATLPHAPGAIVVGTAEEAKALPGCKKLGVVVQTTQSRVRLSEVVGVLLSKAEEVRVMNTICEATSGHQGACAALAAKADVMVVIGGRISATPPAWQRSPASSARPRTTSRARTSFSPSGSTEPMSSASRRAPPRRPARSRPCGAPSKRCWGPSA